MNRFLQVAISGLIIAASGPSVGANKTPPTTGGTTGSIQQTPWFSDAQVRQQFKMTDDQFNRLNRAYGDQWTRYQGQIKDLPQDLKGADRDKRVNEIQRDFYGNFAKSTKDIITDSAQQRRFSQLDLQYRGWDAFTDPTVQQKLNLTAEQKQKLNQYIQDWDQQMAKLRQSYPNEQKDTVKRFNELQERSVEQRNAFLTPEQRRTWEEMTGESYRFPPTAYFPQAQSGK